MYPPTLGLLLLCMYVRLSTASSCPAACPPIHHRTTVKWNDLNNQKYSIGKFHPILWNDWSEESIGDANGIEMVHIATTTYTTLVLHPPTGGLTASSPLPRPSAGKKESKRSSGHFALGSLCVDAGEGGIHRMGSYWWCDGKVNKRCCYHVAWYLE